MGPFPHSPRGVLAGPLPSPTPFSAKSLARPAGGGGATGPHPPSPTGTVNRVVRGVTIHAFPVAGDG